MIKENVKTTGGMNKSQWTQWDVKKREYNADGEKGKSAISPQV